MRGLLVAAAVSLAGASGAQELPDCAALPVLDSPQKILYEIGAWRGLELSPDPRDKINAEFGPALDRLQARAEAIASGGELDAVQGDFLSWRLSLLRRKYGGPARARLGGAFCSFIGKETRKTSSAVAMMRALDEQSQAARAVGSRAAAFARASSPFDNAGPRTAPSGADASVVMAPAPYAPGDPARYDKIRHILASQRVDPRIVDMAIAEAARQDADPLLVLSVINAESRFDPRATSYRRDKKGDLILANGKPIPIARGLMQLIPAAGRYMGVSSTSQLYDAKTNLRAGIGYLKILWAQFVGGSMTGADPNSREVKAAIAAYNAGPFAIHNGNVPRIPETQGYVKTVLGYYQQLRLQLGA